MRTLRLPFLALALYCVFIVTGGAVSAIGIALPSLRHLSSAHGALKFGLSALLFVVVRVAEYTPSGALVAWLVAAKQPDSRGGGVGSCAAALALAIALYAAQIGATPTALGATLPVFGATLGWLCASACAEQARGRSLRIACAVGMFVVPLLCAVLLPVLALSSAPTLSQRPRVTTEERHAIKASLRGNDPRKIPVGETRTLTLNATEIDALLRWLADAGLRARGAVRLEEQAFSLQLDVPVPRTTRWLNMSVRSGVAFQDGQFQVSNAAVSLGAVGLPSWLVSRVVSDALSEIQRNRDLGSILSAVSALSVVPEHASVSYGRLEADRGLLSRLVWGEDEDGEIREGVNDYVRTLLDVLSVAPPGDARFEAALTALFARSRSRSVDAPAVAENRNALIALGMVLGHRSLARVVGIRLDDTARGRIDTLRDATTIHGRPDWTRHFAVSAALMVLSDVAPSDAVGILKEELDADGGSGFSFADLLADRAGTRFAELATRDETRAEELQRTLSQGFRSDAYVPSAEGLPEGLPEQEFKAKFGGVGAAPYRALADDIEHRIALLPAYSDS